MMFGLHLCGLITPRMVETLNNGSPGLNEMFSAEPETSVVGHGG